MRVLHISVICCFFFSLPAQDYRSPFNGMEVSISDTTEHYSFLVGGHFYGGSGSGGSGLPASTVLAGLSTMNSTKAAFLVSTGDMFIDAEADRARYQEAFFDVLDMPLINAVGNHDVDNQLYEKIYGKTYFALDLGPDRLVVLDTERDDSDIVNEQLAMLKELISLSARGIIRNVFIVSHRPVWSEDNPRYEGLFRNNTRSLTGCNFQRDVMPMLETIARTTPVYWFSGSMGGTAPSSIFMDSPQPGITFLQSAIRDRKRDALILVTVNKDGVDMQPIGLSGQDLPPIRELGIDYWRKYQRKAKGFNWRLIPYYVKTYSTHPAFWWGVGIALLLSIGYRSLRDRVL